MGKNIQLKDAFKQYTIDQDKTLLPQETVKRFKEKLKKCNLDILEQTIRIDNGRLDIPVFFSMCGKDALSTIGTKKQMGKGATPQQAEASAVMELAERYSFFSFCKNPENFFMDTYPNVINRAISFEWVAQSVHDHSDELQVTRSLFENLPLKWATAFNLTRGQEVLIPFDWFFMINEFNGTCAGNCAEEAISQGICEVVERHVSSIISQNRLQVPLIDPLSATDPMVRNLLEKYGRNGITLHLSDFTLDMGIPTVGALAYDLSTFPEKSEIVWTAGTTSSPQKALSRALTEVAQLAGDFNSRSNYMASGLPKFKTLSEAEYITGAKKKINIRDLPDLSDPNIKTEIQNCIASLKAKGMEVIVMDIRHPVLGIPAFYTIIPGAHFRERSLGTSVGLFSAKLLTESRPPQEALHALLQIERLLPKKYYIQFYIGCCYRSMGIPETALAYYQKALDLDSNPQDLASIYSYMGQCLKDMGQYRKALKMLKEGEKIDRERTDIYNLMGYCYFKLKEYEQAIDSFNEVLRLNPASAIDYANIASNYRDMGDSEKAIRYYELALAMDPSIDFARENLYKMKRRN